MRIGTAVLPGRPVLGAAGAAAPDGRAGRAVEEAVGCVLAGGVGECLPPVFPPEAAAMTATATANAAIRPRACVRRRRVARRRASRLERSVSRSI
ncbi:MAG TPA: hypothetical protein VGO14_08835 [Solirubrobacteraceae bacterium]|jgi:hypothetical protein|nr:hypothetical protein [Solirubrobacteraceae bacterium]